jgi:hypothetical protein
MCRERKQSGKQGGFRIAEKCISISWRVIYAAAASTYIHQVFAPNNKLIYMPPVAKNFFIFYS